MGFFLFKFESRGHIRLTRRISQPFPYGQIVTETKNTPFG